jgi:hypothetical protein
LGRADRAWGLVGLAIPVLNPWPRSQALPSSARLATAKMKCADRHPLAHNAGPGPAGQPPIIFDPSGPLARMAALPELVPFSLVLDLTTSKVVTLSPYQLVPEPTRDAYTEGGVFNLLEFARGCPAQRRGAPAADVRCAADVAARDHAPAALHGRDAPHAQGRAAHRTEGRGSATSAATRGGSRRS